MAEAQDDSQPGGGEIQPTPEKPAAKPAPDMTVAKMREWLRKWIANATGHPRAFVLAAVIVIAWAAVGPIFGFSDTWQLVINTSTTIITFLMVFLIQSTQNRDSEAMQVKLDEIIRAIGNAKNELLDIEELEEYDLDKIRKSYADIARTARRSP